MGDEVPLQYESSVAAPVIFLIIVAFQLLSIWLGHLKKSGSKSSLEIQLLQEIKQLLKEASSLSQPSTFAQAAKLRRLAAAKEKELKKSQELLSKEMKMSYDIYGMVLTSSKVLTYLLLVFWFWRVPVASIPQQLVQPFGKVLSWWSGSNNIDDNVKVGIIPWLILSTRVTRLLSRVFQYAEFALASEIELFSWFNFFAIFRSLLPCSSFYCTLF